MNHRLRLVLLGQRQIDLHHVVHEGLPAGAVRQPLRQDRSVAALNLRRAAQPGGVGGQSRGRQEGQNQRRKRCGEDQHGESGCEQEGAGPRRPLGEHGAGGEEHRIGGGNPIGPA